MKPEANLTAIASFIGGRLNHPRPPCNGGRFTPVSTIYVEQYKVKFDKLRVYCTLAWPELVQAAWTKWGKEGEPDEGYKAQRLLADTVHYRRCYRDMVALVPHEEEAICDQADYTTLVCPNIDGALACVDSWSTTPEEGERDWVAGFLRKYHVTSRDEHKEFLKKVYATTDDRFFIA